MFRDLAGREPSGSKVAALAERRTSTDCTNGGTAIFTPSAPASQETSAASLSLRLYQEVSLDGIRDSFRRGNRRVLFVLPTGGGKTIIFLFLAVATAARGKRVVILVHRTELIQQTARALQRFGIEFGIIAPGYPQTDAPVQIASVLTLVRRIDRFRDFDLVVIDEAHHAVAGSWLQILEAYEGSFVLAVSATPERLDGRGLGDVFEDMVVGPSVADLIQFGFLAPAVVYAPNHEIDLTGINTVAGDYDQHQLAERMMSGGLVGDAVEHYRKLASGVRGIAFCTNIAHSKAVAAEFTAAGYRAAHVDGNTPAEQRRATMAGLANGNIDIITNCGLISEGFDAPAVSAVLLMRPTRSLGLYLQMVGRALRPGDGKKAIILDHAGNVHRHGLPDQERPWSLTATRRKAGKAAAAPVKQCPECYALVPAAAQLCPECFYRFPGREIEQVAGALVEVKVDPAALGKGRMSYREVIAWAGRDRDRLRRVQVARNYHPKWIDRRLDELSALSP
jgi:superfamily II DNA or RNA helicase